MQAIVKKWCDQDEQITSISKDLRELRKEQKETTKVLIGKLREQGATTLITERGKKLELSSTLKKTK